MRVGQIARDENEERLSRREMHEWKASQVEEGEGETREEGGRGWHRDGGGWKGRVRRARRSEGEGEARGEGGREGRAEVGRELRGEEASDDVIAHMEGRNLSI